MLKLSPIHEFTAHQIPLQKEAEVLGFSGDPSLIERLKEMGIFQGLRITCCGQAPFGGPKLFRLGATVIALREEEAQCLQVKL